MKLGMTLLVRDEIDIVKHHIDYHKSKVNKIVVTDNGSVDGTLEYLRSIENENLIVFEEKEHNYLQDKWVTNMVFALKEMGMDWVVNSDADEFWRGDIFNDAYNADRNGFDCIYVNSYAFKSTYLDDGLQTNPALRILWRDIEYEKYPKVIVSTGHFKSIGKGNDEAYFNCDIKTKISDKCCIYHYCNRGFEHFCKKYLDGGKAIEESTKAGQKWNSGWSKPYSVYKEKGMNEFVHYWHENFYYDSKNFNDAELVLDRNLQRELENGK